VQDQHQLAARFEHTVLPHLDAAYNLARWLTHDPDDAEDVVQEACLRAFRFFHGFHGGDSRAWLLKIVRNTCYTWLQRNRARGNTTTLDDNIPATECAEGDPATLVLNRVDQQVLAQAVAALPVEFREVLVLRELEGLSYKEIAGIADIPVGTVMSRLARARKRMQHDLAEHVDREALK
jgi:RNA polymerase sigma-70 factor, ECF subfamily